MRVKLLYISILLLAFVSCNEGVIYNEYIEIPREGWHADSVKVFAFNIQDTTKLYDIIMNIRHTPEYPWQNYWVFTERVRPDSLIFRDTIQTLLADDAGNWQGKGFGSLYHYEFFLKKNFRFKKTGKFEYKITHGMRDTILTGIRGVGLKISLSGYGEK